MASGAEQAEPATGPGLHCFSCCGLLFLSLLTNNAWLTDSRFVVWHAITKQYDAINEIGREEYGLDKVAFAHPGTWTIHYE